MTATDKVYATYDYYSDTAANRPATPTGNRAVVYLATDTGTVSIWNGTAWNDLLSNTTTGKVLASGTPPTWTATPSVTSITFGSGTALSVYQEGTWTPSDASGAGLTFTGVGAKYTKIGKHVTIEMFINIPVTASAAEFQVGGLPYSIDTFGIGYSASGSFISNTTTANAAVVLLLGSGNTIVINSRNNGANVLNSDMSGKFLEICNCYLAV